MSDTDTGLVHKVQTADGNIKRVAGFTDKEATRQLAAKLEREVEMEAVGIRDPYKAHRQRPLDIHLADYEKNSEDHVLTTEHETLSMDAAFGSSLIFRRQRSNHS